MTTKQPIKPIKATRAKNRQKSRRSAKTRNPPVPDFYLNDMPHQVGRANIKIDIAGKATAHMSVPAKHLNGITGLTVGVSAVSAPVVAVGIACYAQLGAGAMIAVTAMVSSISLVALLLLFYMLHTRDQSKPD